MQFDLRELPYNKTMQLFGAIHAKIAIDVHYTEYSDILSNLADILALFLFSF